jgi:glycosyltransferase involved in cell wall biosynthesis
MDKLRLSIAMCTYNGAQYLQEQLDSIAAQSRLPDELVVCDDRSSDSTTEIVKSFMSKVSFPVRIHINEENIRIIKNFEKAISLCTGDIIALCDQDDVWKPNKLEKILTAFAENIGAGYVFSDADLVNENLQPLGSSFLQSVAFKGNLFEQYIHGNQVGVLLKRNVVCGATMAFRASLKSLVLPISSSAMLLHDAWIALLASSAGFHGVPLSDSLIYYRQHTTQSIGGKDTFSKKLKRVQKTKGGEFYEKHKQELLEVRDRLKQNETTFSKDIHNELNLIQQKANHYARRAFIRSSSNLPLKLKAIATETLTGKYHRFSTSWQSVAKDLWL